MGTLTARDGLGEGRQAPPLPARALRVLGTALALLGAAVIVWVAVVWRWQDPVTAIYTHLEQRHLAGEYARRTEHYHLRTTSLADAAAAYARSLHRGDPVGRLRIPRIGLDMVVVQGTDETTLRKGPGHYVASALPGEGRLTYVAGHRTTFLAPFSHIDELRAGDAITFELPYGTFRYRVTRHYVVGADDTRVLRNTGTEILRLQACHPRFFATHRYIVDARPID